MKKIKVDIGGYLDEDSDVLEESTKDLIQYRGGMDITKEKWEAWGVLEPYFLETKGRSFLLTPGGGEPYLSIREERKTKSSKAKDLVSSSALQLLLPYTHLTEDQKATISKAVVQILKGVSDITLFESLETISLHKIRCSVLLSSSKLSDIQVQEFFNLFGDGKISIKKKDQISCIFEVNK